MKQRARNQLMLFLLAMVVFILLASLVVQLFLGVFEHHRVTYFQALFYVFETLTTTGYGELGAFHSIPMMSLSMFLQVSGLVFIFMIALRLIWEVLSERMQILPPTKAPEDLSNHVIISAYNSMVLSLIEELRATGTPYLVMEPVREKALELKESGINCVWGDPSLDEVLHRAGADRCRYFIANDTDERNTIVVLTAAHLVRGSIIALVEDMSREMHLRHAGAEAVLSPKELLGTTMAENAVHFMSTQLYGAEELFREVKVVELPVLPHSPLVGTTIGRSGIREKSGATVVGVWQNGTLGASPSADTVINENSVLLVMGNESQLRTLKSLTIGPVKERSPRAGHFLILGAGDVGRRIAALLKERDIPYRVVDLKGIPNLPIVEGDATKEEVLLRAGISEAAVVLVALNSDLHNIFATLIARNLNSEVPIIARANAEETIDKLYKAGADFVMSLSVIAGRMLAGKVLKGHEFITLSEGLKITRTSVDRRMAGRSISEVGIRKRTGCTLIAVQDGDKMVPNPAPAEVLKKGDVLYLLGNSSQVCRIDEL